jgi:putative transposase
LHAFEGWAFGARLSLSRKADEDAPALRRMAGLAAQYPRYGYRRIAIFLNRDGFKMSFGRAYRLWALARLQAPKKRPRKRISSGRPRPQAPSGANQVWSYDFVFDWCANGQQLKCLTVTDEWTKEGLAIEVDGRIRSGRVIEVLAPLVSERGAPRFMRSVVAGFGDINRHENCVILSALIGPMPGICLSNS